MYKTIMDAVGKSDPVVFLIGAHRGNDVQYLWRMFPRMSALYAFEPSPDAFTELSRLYGNDKRIHLYNLAVSNQVGLINFELHPACEMTSSLLPVNPQCVDYVAERSVGAETITVGSIRLDNFCFVSSVPRIDFLYSDAQGCEGLILEGAGDMLKNGSIPVMFLEMMNTDMYSDSVLMPELSKRLEGCGYRKIAMFNEAITNDKRLIHADVLWKLK